MELGPIAARYERFATFEAAGKSDLYVELARGVAGDVDTLSFLAGLPVARQQPNLLFAAVRAQVGAVRSWNEFRAALRGHRAAILSVMRTRTTQTNEPGRCALLLPVLTALPQPLALIEVGASAGLCLLPDRYGYDYEMPDGAVHRIEAAVPGAPVFPCRVGAGTPVPDRAPEVVWRAGLDLNPLALTDPDAVRWLETLVWPGQDGRLERLRQAIALARDDPPRVVRGDLRSDLRSLAEQAPRDATLVVFHTAVLAYVPDPADRAAFTGDVARLPATWLGIEESRFLPDLADPVLAEQRGDSMLVCHDGKPLAWADGHGRHLEWRTPDPERPTRGTDG